MQTRSKTDLKREQLKNTLRERCRVGALVAGEMVPGVRDLASEFSLSRDVVAESLRDLVTEGVLYTVPRVGTFVGRPVGTGEQTYLMVYGPRPLQSATGQLVKMAFEDRISELGGVPMVLEILTALQLEKSGKLPPIAGVLDYSVEEENGSQWLKHTRSPHLPRVRFGVWPMVHPHTDFVTFDDVKGGRQATQHLQERGYEKIAFLGFHPLESDSSRWHWSRDREQGWRSAMEKQGLDCTGLAFYAQEYVVVEDNAGVERVMQAPVDALIARGDIEAVVAANDAVAHCLLNGLNRHNVAQDKWPAIVGFDSSAEVSAQLLTSLRMPWTEVGRATADLLWNRVNVQLDRKPEVRRFPMRLVTRLSCRPNWSRAAGSATLAIARTN